MTDHAPRRVDVFMQMLLPLLIGVVIGVLGSYATIAGRIATIEERQRTDDKRIGRLEVVVERQTEKLSEIGADLKRLLGRR